MPLPAWVKVGEPVIAVNYDGSRPAARVTEIIKVNPKTFRVEGEDYLYRCSAMGTEAVSERIGGTWGYRRHVMPLSSDAGQRECRAMRRRNAQRMADGAYEAWRKSRSAADREALLTALDVAERYEPLAENARSGG